MTPKFLYIYTTEIMAQVHHLCCLLRQEWEQGLPFQLRVHKDGKSIAATLITQITLNNLLSRSSKQKQLNGEARGLHETGESEDQSPQVQRPRLQTPHPTTPGSQDLSSQLLRPARAPSPLAEVSFPAAGRRPVADQIHFLVTLSPSVPPSRRPTPGHR